MDTIIIISHSNYRIKSAGVEKYIGDITPLLNKNNYQVVQIFPVIEVNKFSKKFKSSLEYVGININGNFEGIFNEKKLYESLNFLSQKYEFNYKGILLNHLHGWNLDSLEKTLSRLNLLINIFIHDYEMICENTLKTDGNGEKCRVSISKPEYSKCEACKYGWNSLLQYKRNNNFLECISDMIVKVVAPSEIARKVWIDSFKKYENKSKVRPHTKYFGTYKKLHTNSKIRIAYLGSISEHKGYKEWCDLVKQLDTNQYELYYFGKNDITMNNVRKVFVDFQSGSNMIEELRRHNIDIVFLWSKSLETYCYTYYEAYCSGCYIITNNYSGNIAYEVLNNTSGKVFETLKDSIIFFKNTTQIKTILENQINRSFPLELLENDDIDDLTFDNQKKYAIDKVYKKRNKLLSIIYNTLRGGY